MKQIVELNWATLCEKLNYFKFPRSLQWGFSVFCGRDLCEKSEIYEWCNIDKGQFYKNVLTKVLLHDIEIHFLPYFLPWPWQIGKASVMALHGGHLSSFKIKRQEQICLPWPQNCVIVWIILNATQIQVSSPGTSSKCWLDAPSLSVWAWRRRKDILTKGDLINESQRCLKSSPWLCPDLLNTLDF